MGVPLTTHRISVEEHLSTPEYDHSEYVGGEIVDLNVGTRDHSKIQKRCARRLDEYADAHPRMFFGTEAHCRLSIADEVSYRLPDVALIVDDDQPHERYSNRAPDLAVEIKSPEDTVAAQLANFSDYVANGCKLGWLMLPDEGSVIVLQPAAAPRTAVRGEILDGGNLLPGFSVPVDDLFA
jgi:Uma2 family endonuclease